VLWEEESAGGVLLGVLGLCCRLNLVEERNLGGDRGGRFLETSWGLLLARGASVLVVLAAVVAVVMFSSSFSDDCAEILQASFEDLKAL
jgi:hypothetical protein